MALDGLAYNGVTYVAVGYRGVIATSYDGVNWTWQASPTQNYMTRSGLGWPTFRGGWLR